MILLSVWVVCMFCLCFGLVCFVFVRFGLLFVLLGVMFVPVSYPGVCVWFGVLSCWVDLVVVLSRSWCYRFNVVFVGVCFCCFFVMPLLVCCFVVLLGCCFRGGLWIFCFVWFSVFSWLDLCAPVAFCLVWSG